MDAFIEFFKKSTKIGNTDVPNWAFLAVVFVLLIPGAGIFSALIGTLIVAGVWYFVVTQKK